MQQSTEKMLKNGNTICTAFIATNMLAITTYLAVMQWSVDKDQRLNLCETADVVVSISCYVLFVLLAISVSFLIYRLRKLRDVVTLDNTLIEQNKIFNSEIKTLVVILVIFCSSYLVRGVWNNILSENRQAFGKLMIQLLAGLIFDCIPIMFLLIYHLRNFNTKSEVLDN